MENKENATSSATAPSMKRKRDNALEILEDMASRKMRALSPDTQAEKDLLIGKAKRAVTDFSMGHDDLRSRWKSFTKLIVAQENHEKLTDELQVVSSQLEQEKAARQAVLAKFEKYKGSTAKLRREVNRVEYLTTIGDWLLRIQNRIKGTESQLNHGFKQELQAGFKAGGMTSDQARVEAEKYTDFKPVARFNVEELLAKVDKEISAIETWRNKPTIEKAGSQPATQYLDRLKLLSQNAKIERSLYLDILRTSNSRNKLAHSGGVPLDKYLGAGTKPNWNAIWNECKQAKARAKTKFAVGTYTENERDFFLRIIDVWFKGFVQGWYPDGEPILEGKEVSGLNTEKVVVNGQERLVSKTPPAPKTIGPLPPSPYKEGKWDDI
ncbi:hypothetical protein S40288_11068 [Stachybotrys chartarum IBT 40288]|nr:hypothetical protein S40288_11068 [Stachybotrys chartarum IBT 40288]